MKAACQLLATILSVTFISGIESRSLILKNKCPHKIWPVIKYPIGGATGIRTGLGLDQEASYSYDASANWAGSIWARTFCGNTSSGSLVCSVEDCVAHEADNVELSLSEGSQIYTANTGVCNVSGVDQPVTLAEFGFFDGSMDSYDVSLVNGFNLPMSITPVHTNCPITGCTRDVNSVCPSELVVMDSNGRVVGCNIVCNATDCSDDYSWLFKSQCPESPPYASTKYTNTLACDSTTDFVITFCPTPQPEYLEMICVI